MSEIQKKIEEFFDKNRKNIELTGVVLGLVSTAIGVVYLIRSYIKKNN